MMSAQSAWPAEGTPLYLPKPRQSGGRPLLETIGRRKSARLFQVKPLAMQTLSDLLWSAFGISGDHLEHRTAPSARNWRETDIFVVLAQGAYRFDPVAERLEPVTTRDIRAETGKQDFAAIVPVNLVYVSDFAKMEGATDDEKRFYAGIDVGAIFENACLFCASEGLATVVRTSIDRPPLARSLGLRSEQQIVAAQSIGYPAQ